MQTERRVAANPQTTPIDLGWESAENWLLSSTSTIAIIIVTQPDTQFTDPRGWKAESTYYGVCTAVGYAAPIAAHLSTVRCVRQVLRGRNVRSSLFQPCDAVLAPYMLSSCVCPSLCPSQAGIVSKRLDESSWFWHGCTYPTLWLFTTSRSTVTLIVQYFDLLSICCTNVEYNLFLQLTRF